MCAIHFIPQVCSRYHSLPLSLSYTHNPLDTNILCSVFQDTYMLFNTQKPINDPKTFVRWMLRKNFSLYDGIDD